MTQKEGLRRVQVAAAMLIAFFFTMTAGAQDDGLWQTSMKQAADARRSGQHQEVEKLLKAALAEAEKFGPSDRRVMITLDALGTSYYTQGVYIEALPVFGRMLEIRERTLGPDHSLVAQALNNVAVIESVLKKAESAEAHSERALSISERASVGLTGITAIAAGGNHTCTLSGAGQAHCWGSNLEGQLGVSSPQVSAYPVTMSRVTNAVALAAGNNFTCALLSDRTVTCWGANASGQTGAAAGPPSAPSTVPGIQGVQAITAGADHACALLEGGTVKCWGDNQRGQLGNGTVAKSAAPVEVSGITGARLIASGGNHSCVAVTDGGVDCWGAFATGAEPMVKPVRVPGLAGNVTSLAAGSNYACALLSDGTVSCWFGNKQPAPGAASPSFPLTPPETITGIEHAKLIAAGYAHTCALLMDGSARCWGNNREGQLGDGKTTNSTAPVVALNITAATALSAGIAHTCAVLASQTARCWGTDSYGAPNGVVFSLQSHVPVAAGRDESAFLSSLNVLADVYRVNGKFDKAEPLYQRTLQLLEKTRGPEDESLAPVLNVYAEMLRKAGRVEDAAKIEARAQSILFKPVLTDVPTQPAPAR